MFQTTNQLNKVYRLNEIWTSLTTCNLLGIGGKSSQGWTSRWFLSASGGHILGFRPSGTGSRRAVAPRPWRLIILQGSNLEVTGPRGEDGLFGSAGVCESWVAPDHLEALTPWTCNPLSSIQLLQRNSHNGLWQSLRYWRGNRMYNQQVGRPLNAAHLLHWQSTECFGRSALAPADYLWSTTAAPCGRALSHIPHGFSVWGWYMGNAIGYPVGITIMI